MYALYIYQNERKVRFTQENISSIFWTHGIYCTFLSINFYVPIFTVDNFFLIVVEVRIWKKAIFTRPQKYPLVCNLDDYFFLLFSMFSLYHDNELFKIKSKRTWFYKVCLTLAQIFCTLTSQRQSLLKCQKSRTKCQCSIMYGSQ